MGSTQNGFKVSEEGSMLRNKKINTEQKGPDQTEEMLGALKKYKIMKYREIDAHYDSEPKKTLEGSI